MVAGGADTAVLSAQTPATPSRCDGSPCSPEEVAGILEEDRGSGAMPGTSESPLKLRTEGDAPHDTSRRQGKHHGDRGVVRLSSPATSSANESDHSACNGLPHTSAPTDPTATMMMRESPYGHMSTPQTPQKSGENLVVVGVGDGVVVNVSSEKAACSVTPTIVVQVSVKDEASAAHERLTSNRNAHDSPLSDEGGSVRGGFTVGPDGVYSDTGSGDEREDGGQEVGSSKRRARPARENDDDGEGEMEEGVSVDTAASSRRQAGAALMGVSRVGFSSSSSSSSSCSSRSCSALLVGDRGENHFDDGSAAAAEDLASGIGAASMVGGTDVTSLVHSTREAAHEVASKLYTRTPPETATISMASDDCVYGESSVSGRPDITASFATDSPQEREETTKQQPQQRGQVEQIATNSITGDTSESGNGLPAKVFSLDGIDGSCAEDIGVAIAERVVPGTSAPATDIGLTLEGATDPLHLSPAPLTLPDSVVRSVPRLVPSTVPSADLSPIPRRAGGKDAPVVAGTGAPEHLFGQIASLLARVEFLERRQSLEAPSGPSGTGSAAAVGWGSVGHGEVDGAQRNVLGGNCPMRMSRPAISGSGYLSPESEALSVASGGGVDYASSYGFGGGTSIGVGKGSGDPGRLRGAPHVVLTPPKMSRPRGGVHGGSAAELHGIGVSTTPFTGLDVLFRTPKNVQPPQESVDSSHPPLSPSRGQTRWAPPPGPRSPRRSRLTWCAGDRQETIEARGGRVPPRDMPDSPPFWSLSDSLSERQRIGGRGREALPEEEACSAGQGTLTSRPRSATEGVAGAGIVVRAGHGSPERDGDRRRRDVFSGGLDSGRRSDRSRSPGGRRTPRSQIPLLRRRRDEEDDFSREDGERNKASPGSPMSGALSGGSEKDSGGASRGFSTGAGTGPISLLGYLRVEIFGAEDHGVVDTQANRAVRNFLTVPRQLEKLLLFGMLVCVDTFLYVTTFLPIRIVISIASALFHLVTRRQRPRVNRPLLYDWMRGLTIAAALCSLQFLEMSRVYHYIRGQAMVKLYVLIAMVEIFDKLMCSFGQDAQDSLYLSTVHKKKRRVLIHFVVVCVTACLHSLLLFVHVTTLTVAVNSSDQALLTLLISNNFAEIKSSVFKKFDKHNLFQLSCHDVVERFKLALFLTMIMLLNVCQGGLDDPILQFWSMFVMVFGGEVLADWIKHGFIIKFNQLTPSIYEEYSTILARDVAAFRKDDGSTLDHTHFVARRLAFATVPLNCVMIRFIQMAIPKLLQRLPDAPPAALWVTALLFYLLILALKVLTGISLMAQSCTLHPEAVISSTAAASWLRSPIHGGQKTRRELSLEKLSTIERFTLWKGRIV